MFKRKKRGSFVFKDDLSDHNYENMINSRKQKLKDHISWFIKIKVLSYKCRCCKYSMY